MPELPEVETVRTGLAPHVSGQVIATIQCHRPDLRYPLPDLSSLNARTITNIRRRSKYLLFDIDHGMTLVWHLGMTGQFHWLNTAAEPGRHEHVRIDFMNGGSLRYRDARRFGYAGLIPTHELDQHPWFQTLGPEPLESTFNASHLAAVCSGRKAPIKSVIMDAKNVVGVGNIYASESLFRCGIHPQQAAGKISHAHLARLVACIKAVLAEAIEAGGSTISDFVATDGKPGYFAHNFRVYGRKSEPCLICETPIRHITIAGRSSFFCPTCQPQNG